MMQVDTCLPTLLVGLELLVLALKPHYFVSKADFYILFFPRLFIYLFVPFSRNTGTEFH